MIGPYGRKPTNGGSGAPLEIDFDALWDRALAPTVHSMGYEPTRADMDTGGLILHQMFRRLSLADLVLADLTIPNGNVYYEVGVRSRVEERRLCIAGGKLGEAAVRRRPNANGEISASRRRHYRTDRANDQRGDQGPH